MPGRSWWTPPSAGIALRFNDRIVAMEMMNKLGIAVIDSPRAVRNELLQGTGAVMAPGCSIFVESSNVKDKEIVVFRSPGKDITVERKAFDVEHFDRAWKQFDEWRSS